MVGSMLKYACSVGTVEVEARKDPNTIGWRRKPSRR
jgi:hypothetical protein